MTCKITIIGLLVGLSSVASAQPLVDLSNVAPAGTGGSLWVSSFDPTDATAPVSVVEGRGWKVGEGTVIHPVVGLSTGYDSNVFFQDADTQAAAVLRVIAQFSVASLSFQRLHPGLDPMAAGMGEAQPEKEQAEGDFQYWASVRLSYDQVLSGNSTANDTGGTGVGTLLRALINPNGNFQAMADENFERVIRAQNFETSKNANRDINVARLTLWYQPHDHALSGYLYYYNTIDVFENNVNTYPDRMFNRVGIHPMWLRLPQTKLFADASISNVTGIGSDPVSQVKVTSYPLDVRVGVSTLLNLRSTLNASVGYTNGFYSKGPSYSGVDVDTLLAFRYSPLGRLGIGYSLVYQDSVNANFFRDHLIRGFLMHDMAPVVFVLAPELHFREYQGLTIPGNMPVRDDTIFGLVAGLHYAYRDWIGIVLDYRYSVVSTDFRYMDANGNSINPSYQNHEAMLGMRVAM
jgi:hypothetical protein